MRLYRSCFFFLSDPPTTEFSTLSLHDALPIFIELNALHTKRQNLFQELDAVIHLLMEAKHWGLPHQALDRKSGSAGMPRPISYAVFCLKKKSTARQANSRTRPGRRAMNATSAV